MIIYVPFPSSPLHALTPTIVLVRSRQFYLLLHHDQVNIVHVEARCVLGLCFLLIFLFCPKIILLLFSFYLLGLLKSYLSSVFFCQILRPLICLMMLFPKLSRISGNHSLFPLTLHGSAAVLAGCSLLLPLILEHSLLLFPVLHIFVFFPHFAGVYPAVAS